MVDFADLAIRTDYSSVDKATAALDRLNAAGQKVEQSTTKIGVSSVAATRNMGAWDAIQAEAAGHVGAHALAIGSLERRLASAIEPMLGVNKIAGVLAVSLLKFGIGSIETVGILAGIYAITFAWGKFTEEVTKAAKAQDEMIKKADATVLTRVHGAGGELGEMITGLKGRQSDINRQLEGSDNALNERPLFGSKSDFRTKLNDENALLNVKIKILETDKQLAEAREYAGSVSTPYDRAVARGTSLDGFYSKALASEAQLSELAKSGTFVVRDAAIQAMGAMEKIINHVKLIRMGLAESPSQVLGLPSDVALGGLKATGGALGAGIDIAGRHGGSIADFSSQIQAYLRTTSTALNEQGAVWTTVKQGIQAAADQAQLYADAVILAAGGGDRYAASIRNRQSSNGALNNAEAQTKYGQSLADREAALKMPAAFDAVREAALKLGEGLRTAKQSLELTAQAWKRGNIVGGIEAGATGGVADALSQFTPQALTYKAVTSGLNFIAQGFMDMASSMLDGGAAAREYARALRQQTDEYAAAIAQFKHDDLAATLAQNSASAEQLIKQMEDLYGNVSALIKAFQTGTLVNPQTRIDDIKGQEAKNAEIIKRNAGYALEDLAVRNERALGQGDAANLQAFKDQQTREMQAAIDANRDATYLNTLQTTLNNELIAYQNGLLSTALRNAPTGFYGAAAYIGQYATPRSADPFGTGMPAPNSPVNPTGGLTPPGGSGGRPVPRDLTVNVMLPDGRVLTRAVVKDLDQTASASNGAGSSRSQALDMYN